MAGIGPEARLAGLDERTELRIIVPRYSRFFEVVLNGIVEHIQRFGDENSGERGSPGVARCTGSGIVTERSGCRAHKVALIIAPTEKFLQDAGY